MSLNYLPSYRELLSLDTQATRNHFLIENLFQAGAIQYHCYDSDRLIVGAACPESEPLELNSSKQLYASYFCERRELGVINIGDAGKVSVDGVDYTLDPKECIYIARGSQKISFSSIDDSKPCFYFVSYPAHQAYQTQKISLGDANRVELGSTENSNARVIYQFIHKGGVQSCQLVMGFTELLPGSVWNTMPAHTHDRRSEIYLYFDIPDDHSVFHFMGKPQETRHLCVQNKQAVLSPSWSIHSGCGTSNYGFIWAMGGENRDFDDMDGVRIADLR